jgi:hypothetical protein
MDCPQCGAEVPSDDAFCGKCGYARRDQGPQRIDQSRIRVHEAPGTIEAESTRSPSQQRVRKHTVLGMPKAKGPVASPPAPPAPPPPPTLLSSARSARSRARTPQKTMLGIPRDEIPKPPDSPSSVEPTNAERSTPQESPSGAPSDPAPQSHRARARVRYDSANEPLPVTERRKKVLRGLAVLIILAAAWLGYRFITVNG